MSMYVEVEPVPEHNKYKLLKSVIVEGVKIPKDFEWDGASIPRIFWEEIGSPFSPKFMVPSLVHDYLYSVGTSSGLNRRQADKLFKKLLLANGVDESLAETMYTGVRVGGGRHYHYE